MMIDFHAHILPGMDHGCANVNCFLQQMEQAGKAGVNLIVATSHFYPQSESVENYLQRRMEAMNQIKMQVGKFPIIRLGAEVLVCNRMQKMERLEELCVTGTNVLLLEMPLQKHIDSELFETVQAIEAERKLKVILAHPNKYSYKDAIRLMDLFVDVQVNADSLDSMHGRKVLRECLKRDNIVAIGSDLHGASMGYDKFTRLCKKMGKKTPDIMERTRLLLD